MASTLALTNIEGGTSINLYGNETAAVAANRLWWTDFSVMRLSVSAWQKIPYTGYDGIDAVWMGSPPLKYSIIGYAGGTEGQITTARGLLFAIDSTAGRYTVTGPIAHANTAGMIVENVKFMTTDSKGGEQQFTFDLIDLGL